MKNQAFTITEHHQTPIASVTEIIHEIIVAWLTKELYK